MPFVLSMGHSGDEISFIITGERERDRKPENPLFPCVSVSVRNSKNESVSPSCMTCIIVHLFLRPFFNLSFSRTTNCNKNVILLLHTFVYRKI